MCGAKDNNCIKVWIQTHDQENLLGKGGNTDPWVTVTRYGVCCESAHLTKA